MIYVGLDSWDNMNWDQRKRFVERCKANGQEAGIYWTPWNDWMGSDSRAVEGNKDNQTLRDFPETEGRYFRLWIDRATQGRDPTARIYMFQVFEAK